MLLEVTSPKQWEGRDHVLHLSILTHSIPRMSYLHRLEEAVITKILRMLQLMQHIAAPAHLPQCFSIKISLSPSPAYGGQ